MIKQFRIWLARRILGAHCPCYEMGSDRMVDFQQRSADKLKTFKKEKCNESVTMSDIAI